MLVYGSFDEARFRANVDKALQEIQSILDTTRHPRLVDASTVDHTYNDKYVLAETLTNVSLATIRTALFRLGVTTEQWQQWCQWVHQEHKTVTLRFQAVDSCALLKENVVEVEDPTAVETTTQKTSTTSSWMSSSSSTTTTKVTRKIKEAHWQVSVSHTLSAFCANNTAEATTITKRDSSTIVVIGGGTVNNPPATTSRDGSNSMKSPIPAHTEHRPIDLNLTWFVQQFNKQNNDSSDDRMEVECQFAIDRNAEETKTPRRNPDIEQAMQFHNFLKDWMFKVETYFTRRVEGTILKQHKPVLGPNVATGAANSPFEPGTVCVLQNITKEPKFNGKQVVIKEYVTPQERYRVEPMHAQDGLPVSLLVKGKDLYRDPHAANAGTVTMLNVGALFCPVQPLMEDGEIVIIKDITALLAGHDKSLDDFLTKQAKIYPPRQVPKVLSITEATIVVLSRHVAKMSTHYLDCVNYLEQLLYNQLVQAIGKQVGPDDFTNFMRFHGRRFMGPAYAPRPFSYAVRRPGHAPDGMISIECDKNDPIDSMVRHVPPSQHTAPLEIPISAATSVPMTGDWYLHGWLMHQFENARANSFSLTARARQFSSFLLIVGNLAGAHKLDPKHAIILQNKDDLLIPLLTEVLPSAKDFKDAIASLSPEQQDFAKAFRGMQLESSVFGVAIIQLKPQLEKLLGLQPNSLTKEIQLTQDLMSLFIEYQIPSDLLSFDGPQETSRAERLAAVKEHVKAVLQVIDGEKEKTIAAEEQKAEYREARFYGDEDIAYGQMVNSPMMEQAMDGPPLQPAMHAMHSAPASRSSSASMRKASATRSSTQMERLMARPARSFASAAPPPALSAPAAPPPAPTPIPQSSPQVDLNLSPDRPPDKIAPSGHTSTPSSSTEDFTMLPKELDAKLESLDTDNSLRSTVLKAGENWTLQRKENLLADPQTTFLGKNEINREKKKAFDLLDAISRSGSLPIEAAELHVIVALSHCFEKNLMGTVIEDNVNPIAKAEKSALLLASTLHRVDPSELLASENDTKRLQAAFPKLFDK